MRALILLGAVAALGAAAPAAVAAPHRPNIVYILADDLSWDLVRFMPEVRRLQRDGMTFRQFVVADSLCCSSRATILTGQFPHNTRVLSNVAPQGGYWAFRRYGARRHSVAISLRRAGYRTALMGKYLNGYEPYRFGPDPGWDEWLGSSYAYRGFGYQMSDNGRPVTAGFRPRDYVTDVLARRAVAFIRHAVPRTARARPTVPRARRPFFLMIATYAPHSPYTPAPRHRGLFHDLPLIRGEAFDAPVKRPPRWLGSRPPLDGFRLAALRRHYRMRARSVQAVDELLGRVRRALRVAGVARNTFVVFGSDNGYHLGQHRLAAGKRTAFDHDIRVPLVVAGPGARRDAATSALAGTVDLAPTFERWARAPMNPNRDGRSLAPLVRGRRPAQWRQALLIEHAQFGAAAGDPDLQGWAAGKPGTYAALRTRRTTYVEYANGDREFYDRRDDPAELDNRGPELTRARRARLGAALQRYRRCAGPIECWAAGR